MGIRGEFISDKVLLSRLILMGYKRLDYAGLILFALNDEGIRKFHYNTDVKTWYLTDELSVDSTYTATPEEIWDYVNDEPGITN